MKDAADYLAQLKALAIANPQVMRCEVQTYPHHVHDGFESNVLPHGAVSAVDVLAYITSSLAG